MAQQGTGRSVLPSPEDATSQIPDKLYFRIGEVADLCGVPTYVLRFWESEFPQLKPNKGGTGQRLYRRKDVETARKIRELLYEGKFTIPGARQALRAELEQQGQAAPQLSLAMAEPEGRPEEGLPADPVVNRQALGRLQHDLRELHDILLASTPPAAKRSAVQPICSSRPDVDFHASGGELFPNPGKDDDGRF